jgi:transaldolase
MAELAAVGQSVWLDYIRRDLLDGELGSLVADGLRGMTSNPTIFEKAIAGTELYDADIAEFVARHPDASAVDVFEHLAIADIREATDQLRTVYDESAGRDGFVSLEVSPDLARDTEGTIAEARRLWVAVDRPNLMIKVPATPEGIPAVEALIGDGINVNVTLMFSMAHYEAVARAFLRGLESCDDPSTVNSVASVFVSRIDSAVDERLDGIGTEAASALKGRAAVANAKVIYARSRELFGEPFVAEWGRGVGPQRPLWASTSTKNPEYPDLLYVEPLVGSDTVNTLPPATLDAFIDHGTVVADAVEHDVAAARGDLAALGAVGIDLDAICDDLQDAGVDSFAASFRSMLDAIDAKRASLGG